MARKILLADDSVTAQNMGRRILADAGYEVITVNNGSAALKKIAEHKPDLIILDVYMPGYGGLELCERLREARETARIPILLSVGKLEPFKADEARRVRADAYIVKPFEATELLTALTKLEDKIVPQPDSYKPGRFAKAVAAIENSKGDTEAGELESNWKDRLKIPSGPRLVERENGRSGSGRKNKAGKDQSSSAEERTEPQASPSIPADITPEEISAIAAAAATLSDRKDAASNEPTPSPTPEPTTNIASAGPEATATTFASSPGVHAPVEITSSTDPASEPQPPAMDAAKAAVSDISVTPEAAAVGERVAQETEPASTPDKPADADVLAALANLGQNDDSTVVAADQVATAELPVAAPRGPRWIAEEMPLGEEESTFILQQEMHKAYAALAACEAKTTFITYAATQASQPAVTTEAVAEVAIAEAPAVPSEPDTAAQPPQNIGEAARVSAAWGEPRVEPVAEASETVQQQSITSETESNLKPEAALAAAAGVGDSAANASATTPATCSESMASQSAHATVEPRNEADLAAAWANWKQIRETVVNSPAETHVAEAKTEPVVEQKPAAQPEAAAPDSEALSSIVDNMLAELKPKLMEELARKLAAEKKK